MRFQIRILLLFGALWPAFAAHAQQPKPKVTNVIYMIGDGMGLAHVSAALIDRGYAPLAMERAPFIGLAKTFSASHKVTDSAAAGTALATGHKTANGMIGVDPQDHPLETLLEQARDRGLATGLVVTCYIAQATPAAFMAHRRSRSDLQGIAADLVASGTDVFIGGGMLHFTQREDGRDLVAELEQKGYAIARDMDQVMAFRGRKLAGILAPGDLPSMADGRGDYLPRATGKALELLSAASPQGFFIMVEGSQIDHQSHANDAGGTIAEVLDFDEAVGVAFDFADTHPGTLVIVTADHETGGLTVPGAKNDKGAEYKFSTGGHTGILVPVFAYGTGAQHFTGVFDNTDLPRIIRQLLGF